MLVDNHAQMRREVQNDAGEVLAWIEAIELLILPLPNYWLSQIPFGKFPMRIDQTENGAGNG